MANVVFDEDSAARIAKAVKYVEGLQNPEEPGEDEAVEQSGRTVIRGTFSGEWAKNTDATVSFTADNGDTGTKTATNYFADVGTAGNTTDCIIMLVGSEWVLVSADPAGSTECAQLSKVEPAGNLTLLAAINPTGSFVQSISGSVVTGVACVNGNLTVTTSSLSNLAGFANLSDVIGYTEQTVRLTDLANVTTQNVTLPPQTGCS